MEKVNNIETRDQIQLSLNRISLEKNWKLAEEHLDDLVCKFGDTNNADILAKLELRIVQQDKHCLHCLAELKECELLLASHSTGNLPSQEVSE